jgi:hypothetical protein
MDPVLPADNGAGCHAWKRGDPGGGSAILPEQQDSVGGENKPNEDEPCDWGHERHCLEPPRNSRVRLDREGAVISLTQDQKSAIDQSLLRLREPMFLTSTARNPMPPVQSKYGAAPQP